MNSRRHFIKSVPLASASMLAAYSETSSAISLIAVTGPSRQAVVTPPATVVIDDWTTGSPVEVGRITFTNLIRTDNFADAGLALDCRGWSEHGPAPTAALPVLSGVQFSAKRFTINAGGQYTQTSYRVLVMMRATGLRDGLYGDPRGVSTYPAPHKLRILAANGAVLKTIEMRDGLPMNHPSLINNPYEYTVGTRGDPKAVGNFPVCDVAYQPRLPGNKAMRPWMSAGSAYVAFFGDTPTSSAQVRNRIPRVKSDTWHMKGTMMRAIYNGDDVHLYDPDYGGNGNAHPEVMPQWAMARDVINALPTVRKNDANLLGADGGYAWINALRLGWDYEPGALGGITRRGGPGGTRVDRTVLPQELLQMSLSQTTRVNDGQPTAAMARGFALNHANYPGYYPRSMATLDAINQFDPTPQPTVGGGTAIPVVHYYGVAANYAGSPQAIWLVDTYGGNANNIASTMEWYAPGVGAARGNGMHPRNGWCPESEHNNRTGTAWSALLYSDPLFTRMAEHMMMFESHLMSPVLVQGWDTGGATAAPLISDAGGYWWNSRSNVLPFATATMMWWVASQNGVYTRAQIEAKMHTFFARWKVEIRDKIPATAVTASQKAFFLTGGLSVSWQSWKAADGNWDDDAGWVASFGLAKAYCGQLVMLLKTSGLFDVLSRNPVTAICLNDLVRQQEFNARMFNGAPWALMNVSTSPMIILRRASKGAVMGDLSTIPTTIGEALSYNPPLRNDDYWFLRTNDVPGVDSYPVNHDPSGFTRIQAAKGWWDLYAPAGAERTAAKALITRRMGMIRDYLPLMAHPGFVRFNAPQTIPAFEA